MPEKAYLTLQLPAAKGYGIQGGLYPFHSPLLGISLLLSFPPLIDMLKFSGPRQIGTDLSHDGLNPAHVPLSLANSQTLGTFSSPRMR